MAKKKVDLYSVHDDLSEYFQLILTTHLEMVKAYKDAFKEKEITASEFQEGMARVTLAPAVLTCIATFLKTNDIMVITDTTKEALSEFEEQVALFKKKGTSTADLDHTLNPDEVN